jgi:hypothetical protein
MTDRKTLLDRCPNPTNWRGNMRHPQHTGLSRRFVEWGERAPSLAEALREADGEIAALTAERDRLQAVLDAWKFVAPVLPEGCGFCPECGVVVHFDEDGLCASCGGTATGTAVDEMRERIAKAEVLEAADRAPVAGGEGTP